MPVYERGGVQLAYDERGRTDGTPLVLLHGFTSDRRMWHQVASLLERDARIVVPDLRGHGESDAPDDIESYSMDGYAADLAALLDRLEVERCHLVGCSFGGMVAMEFAVTSPQRVQTLVLSDTSPAYDRPEYTEEFRERERSIAKMVESIDRFGPLETGRRAARDETNEFFAAGIRRRYAGMRRQGIVGAARARRQRRDLSDLLRTTLTMPVMLCMGEDDPVRSALPVMARELPGARQVTFQQTGHGVPAREPRKFVDSLVDFLDDVKAGKPVATVVSL